MFRILLSALSFLILCGLSSAQDFPRAEIFAGYSYLNVDYQSGVASSTPIPRQNVNGWEVSPAFNINRWFTVEGDFAGYYKNDVPILLGVPNVDLHAYSFTAGPRFNYRSGSATGFVHALVGGDNLYGSISGIGSASQNSITFAVGGGVVWQVRPGSHWAVRGSGDYVLTQHNIANALGFSTPSLTQNNFRASVGVVYLFGNVQLSERPQAQRNASTEQCVGTSESALLGITGCDTASGVKVSSVHAGSPAAFCGIRPGDLITSIDGRAVRSSRDIETAIAANTTGTVKVAFMIQGSFLTQRDAKVR